MNLYFKEDPREQSAEEGGDNEDAIKDRDVVGDIQGHEYDDDLEGK